MCLAPHIKFLSLSLSLSNPYWEKQFSPNPQPPSLSLSLSLPLLYTHTWIHKHIEYKITSSISFFSWIKSPILDQWKRERELTIPSWIRERDEIRSTDPPHTHLSFLSLTISSSFFLFHYVDFSSQRHREKKKEKRKKERKKEKN